MPLIAQIWLVAILAIVLIPAAVRLGWIAGQAAYPLSLEAKRGLQAAVEDRLFNKEMA